MQPDPHRIGSTAAPGFEWPPSCSNSFRRDVSISEIRKREFKHDGRGNRTEQFIKYAAQTITYGYDQANRLTTYNSGQYTYRYNGDGVRMQKEQFLTEQFTWDVSAGLPLLMQDGSASYIYGPGGMLLETVSNTDTPHYYHQDQLGSVRALTDASGTVANTYDYDAYGNITASTGSVYNPFGYTGEYTDSERRCVKSCVKSGLGYPASRAWLVVGTSRL